MTYEEACEKTFIRKETIQIIKEHQIDPEEFFEEVGYKNEYTGTELLNWLGY